MEQLDLFTSTPTEEWVFEQLQEALLQVIAQNNLSRCSLSIERGLKYSSVWFDSQMAFRICCRGDLHYFSVSDAISSNTTDEISQCFTKSAAIKGFKNYIFEPTVEGIAIFTEFLAHALDHAIDSIGKEFDCCSRYEECSNAKHCIHPNSEMALVCGYRKIMKRGRIYYGENRNI